MTDLRPLLPYAAASSALCVDLDPRDFDHPTDVSDATCPRCPALDACKAAGMHPEQQQAEHPERWVS